MISPVIFQDIQHRLQLLENEQDVRVLFAVESGSRAWGFPSVDSDYDVRFVYIHRPDWYLQISEGRDVIEYPINDDLDISGWDIRKAFRLFRKSNPALLEWLRSPVVYAETSEFIGRVRALQTNYFSVTGALHHYLSMTKSNYLGYLLGDRVRVKKYFYALRPMLACRWIETHGTVPPMEFETLLEDGLPDGPLKADIQDLLIRKRQGAELGDGPQMPRLNEFLAEGIAHFTDYARQLPTLPPPDETALNELFRALLHEVWTGRSDASAINPPAPQPLTA
jgi:uncharacterized protein